ncbi:MAG: transcriptional regulator [Bacteroidetes bacterium]|nr:transcriptional regulator [Bacteroidota bacterium]
MEIIELEKDIQVIAFQADSFPTGVLAAHQQAHTLFPPDGKRNYFGMSRPEKGGSIIYKACVEEMYEGEAQKHQREIQVIKAGHYYCVELENFMENPHHIAQIFTEILQQKDIDPEGYCVEWYDNENDEVKCMVRIVN